MNLVLFSSLRPGKLVFRISFDLLIDWMCCKYTSYLTFASSLFAFFKLYFVSAYSERPPLGVTFDLLILD